jgi:hypothetical protein
MKNFNGRPFFSLFFVARANQKIPNLALGRQSIVVETGAITTHVFIMPGAKAISSDAL